MMSLLNALQFSAAAALCNAAPCSPCPPECEESAVVEVRVQETSTPARNVVVARQLPDANAQAVTLLPRIASVVDGDQETRSVVKVVIQNDNGELQYSDVNGNVAATHNGQPVPADRIERDGGAVRILGEDGGTLFEFRVAQPAAAGRIRLDLAPTIVQHAGGGAVAQPRGRIGVYLAPTDATIRAEQGIENEGAVTITGTIEGSPAQEAGLQADDIVVRINGQTASEESLRAIIGETEPGHEVTLRIVRDGEPQDLTVRVGPAEQVQFDQAFEWVEGEPGTMGEEFTFQLEGLDGRVGQLHDHLLQLVPEGEWREHIGNFNPEMLQQLHEKFGDGQQFLELHVKPLIHGRQQWIEHAGPHGEAIREKVLEALRNAELNIDEETHTRIHEAITKALEQTMSGLHNVEVELDDAPVLFDLMERGEGDHIMVLPEGGSLRMMQPATPWVVEVPGHIVGNGDAADRLRRLEERLEKLEALLQQLVERQGGQGARLP